MPIYTNAVQINLGLDEPGNIHQLLTKNVFCCINEFSRTFEISFKDFIKVFQKFSRNSKGLSKSVSRVVQENIKGIEKKKKQQLC